MTYRIKNGDYVVTDSGLQTADDTDGLLQTAAMLLATTRGRFYPNKDFGSYLTGELPYPDREYALAYARLALEGLDGVFVRSAVATDGVMCVDLTINSVEKQVIQEIGAYI